MIWVVSLFNIAIFGWTTFETLSTVGIIGPFTPTFSVPTLFLLWLVGNLILWLIARRLRSA